MAIIFTAALIWILTLGQKAKREYFSFPLMLFCLWALGSVFIHSYDVAILEHPALSRFQCFSLMSEGLIYILAGTALFISVIKYSGSSWPIWAILAVLSVPWVYEAAKWGRISPILALVGATCAYLLIKRHIWLLIGTALVSGILTVLNWPWVVMKFSCRPVIWARMVEQIKEHPIVGQGFTHYLRGDMEPLSQYWGGVYRHNDFLSIASYLGIPALIFLTWFIIDCLKKIGPAVHLIPFLAIVILCCFQYTMFDPLKAAICLTAGALCIKQSQKGEAR
jgi:hypothetical protein